MHRESILPKDVRYLRRWNYVRIYYGLQFVSLSIIYLTVDILDTARFRWRGLQAITQSVKIGDKVRHTSLLLASVLCLAP